MVFLFFLLTGELFYSETELFVTLLTRILYKWLFSSGDNFRYFRV